MRNSFCAVSALALLAAATVLAARPAPQAGASSPSPAAASASPEAPRVAVIVELFTSEGCSDCPPVDKFLAQLGRNQPVPGVLIIPLEEHVDYWDNQGWRDPFSDALFTWRQQWYAQHFGLPSPATPEMVVDGRAQFLGRAIGKMREAIVESAHAPQARVTLTLAAGDDKDSLQAAIRVEDYPAGISKKDDKAEVRVAVTEDDLSSQVRAGENSGKSLEHQGVVRKLLSAGEVKTGEPFSKELKIPLGRGWNPQHLHVVVFLEAHSTHQILGAAIVPVTS